MSPSPERPDPPSRRRAAVLASILLGFGLLAMPPSPTPAQAAELGGPPVAIAGTLLDEGGEPLTGAEVTLHRRLGEEERMALLLAGEAYGEPTARATTGSGGRFRLDAPRAGFWIVLARAPGRLPLVHRLEPLLPPPPGAPDRPTELAPAILPSGTPAVVWIVDSDGLPAPGAVVEVNERESSREDSPDQHAEGWSAAGRVAVADGDGTARVVVPESGEITIRAHDGARWGWRLRVDAAEARARPTLVTLETFRTVRLRIGRSDGRPAEGALVWNHRGPLGRTDEGGWIDLPLVPRIRSLLRVASEDGGYTSMLEPRAEYVVEPLYLTLLPPFPVPGRVVDGATGEAIPSALVWLASDPAGAVLTDAKGRFRLDGTGAPDHLDLRAAAPGFATADCRKGRTGSEMAPPPGDEGRTGPAQAVTIALHRSFRVTGRAVDDQGQPLVGARATLFPENRLGGDDLWLSIDRYTRTTGDDGRFAFDDPFPASSLLVVRAAGRAPHIRSGIAIHPAAGEIDLGDTVLFPEGVIRGRVVDGEGEPVSGAEIHEEIVSVPSFVRDLFDGARMRTPVALTDDRGAFSAGGFLLGEPLQLQARRAEAVSEKQWTYAAPEPLPLELVLVAPARISGTVVDAGGRPVAGAAVAPHNETRPGVSHFAWTRTDEGGRFQVTVPEPGRAILVAQARGHARSEPMEVEVSGGETISDLELALRRGHVLQGRVVDPDGRPIEGVELFAHPGSRAVRTDADGRFAIEDRPAGPVRLELRHEGYLPHEIPVELVPNGDPVEVVFPTAEVAGTLRTADGTPAGGYTVQLSPWDPPTLFAEALQMTTAADGSFRFRGVADGEHLVRVFGPDRPPYGWNRPEPVVVEAGRSVTGLDITLPGLEEER